MKSEKVSGRRKAARDFYREGRTIPGYSFFDFIHGYVYGRWPYFYIGIGTGEHRLAGVFRRLFNLVSHWFSPGGAGSNGGLTFADTYHGKVVSTESASGLVSIEQEISLQDLEPIIPYAAARDIVLKNPDHIVALDCPCRSVRPDPCSPVDVCLIVGEPFASFVLEHQPDHARGIDSREAVRILQAEHERGHVHHAFFKDAMLDRFYAICNCCSCCCGAMQAQRNGTLMLNSSGYLCRIREDQCQGCGICETSCPFDAISMVEEIPLVRDEACMGCGVCVDRCAADALWLERAPEKGEPLEIHSLLAEAAAAEGKKGAGGFPINDVQQT
ncbi:MAG: 4Fe-4S binding protein [Anaerolineales bacterium]|nr:4Fe-4S binding protein [Anaerolineales bacterium]